MTFELGRREGAGLMDIWEGSMPPGGRGEAEPLRHKSMAEEDTGSLPL